MKDYAVRVQKINCLLSVWLVNPPLNDLRGFLTTTNSNPPCTHRLLYKHLIVNVFIISVDVIAVQRVSSRIQRIQSPVKNKHYLYKNAMSYLTVSETYPLKEQQNEYRRNLNETNLEVSA